jgi:hypothetical protein
MKVRIAVILSITGSCSSRGFYGFFAFWLAGIFFVWISDGVGLSLNSWWSISVAPVRGGTYFLCMPQRK